MGGIEDRLEVTENVGGGAEERKGLKLEEAGTGIVGNGGMLKYGEDTATLTEVAGADEAIRGESAGGVDILLSTCTGRWSSGEASTCAPGMGGSGADEGGCETTVEEKGGSI